MKRCWRYGYGAWRPRWWWHWLLPNPGSDEYGRMTWVIPIHPFGFLVWAYRTCRCECCDEIREQTARWEAEGLLEVK